MPYGKKTLKRVKEIQDRSFVISGSKVSRDTAIEILRCQGFLPKRNVVLTPELLESSKLGVVCN